MNRVAHEHNAHFQVLGHPTSIETAEPSSSDHHQLKDCRLQIRNENDELLLTLECNHCLKSFDSPEAFAAHLESEHRDNIAISDRTDPKDNIPDINDTDSLMADNTPSKSPDGDIQRSSSSPSISTPILSPTQFRWEDYYTVAVDCKICGQHLKDQKLYFDHLKDHYDSDPSKKWRECDCGRKIKGDGPFVSHLCGSHEYPHHLHCTQITNGSSCTFTASTKSNMTQHLRKVHGIGNEKRGGTRSKTRSKGNKHKKRKIRHLDVNSEKRSGTRHHPVHDHHLLLVQRTDCDSIICDLCSKVFEGRSWHCTEGCDFDICTDCIDIKVDDLDESAQNEHDIDISTESQSKEASTSVELTESTNSKSRRKRRGRKRKRVEHDSESEKNRVRRKIRKMLQERARDKSVDYKSLYRRNTLRCDDCDLQIKSHPEFVKHMKVEHDELTPYHCHLCSNKYSNRVSLMDHYRKKHEKSNELTENPEHAAESADVIQELNSALIPATHESTTPSQCDDAQQQSPSINWDDYYAISVDCKICGQHFVDCKMYFEHLQNHHDNDPSKKWRECDCGRKWSSSRSFMQHLCGSHGYPHFFRCNQTRYGSPCEFTSSSEGNMKQHLRNVHEIGIGGANPSNTESTRNEQDENEDNSVTNDSGNVDSEMTISDQTHSKQQPSSINWEDYYVVSVDCKICDEHFVDRKLYYDHLKDHYDSEPSKTWRECDCGRKWKDARCFGAHLCGSHDYPHPFQCNQNRDGSPCDFTSSTECNMKQHLRNVHVIGYGNGVNGSGGTNQSITESKGQENDTELEAPSSIPVEHQNDILINDQIDTIEDMELQNDNESVENPTIHDSVANPISAVQPTPSISLPMLSPSKITWKDYYRVSVDCNMCGQHLEDRKLYWEHLKGHFKSDPSKKWLECHCGHISRGSEEFVQHLCGSHGYPHYLHCNQTPCDFSAASISNMKAHLRGCHQIGNEVTNEPTNRSKGNKHNKCKRQNLDTVHLKDGTNTSNQRHPMHDHALSLVLRSDFHSIICDLCSKEFAGRSWHCTERCDFDICRECIAVTDVVGSVENEHDIDLNDATSTDSQSKEASVSVEIMESTNMEPRPRRGRKRKRIEHEFGSERNQNRSKMQKLDAKCAAPYHCHLCSKKYTLQKSLMDHYKDKHEKKTGEFQCEVCQRTFDRKSEWVHHQEQTGHCSVSTERTENEENPVSNDSRSSSAVTTPSQHSQGDDTIQRLSGIHWKDYYVVSVDCKLCGEHFVDRKLYYDHLKDHFDSEPSETWRECDCGRKWKDARTFVTHLCGSHGYPHLFRCNQTRDGSPCDFTSSNESNMKDHLRRVHGIGNENEATQLLSRNWKRWTADEVKTLKLLKQMGKTNEEIVKELNRSWEGIRKKWEELQKNDDRNDGDKNMEQENEETTNEPADTLILECTGDSVAVDDMEQDIDLNDSVSTELESENDGVLPTESNEENPGSSTTLDKHEVSSRIWEKWSDEEVNTLKLLKEMGQSNEEIANELNRNAAGIDRKWRNLQTNNNRKEDDHKMEQESEKQVNMRQHLGTEHGIGNGNGAIQLLSRNWKRWTADEVKTLKLLKQRGKTNEKIAYEMKRTSAGIWKKWKELQKNVDVEIDLHDSDSAESEFTSERNLEDDFRSFYDIRRDTLRCDDCQQSFKNHREFTKHMREEHNEWEPYKCHQCTAQFGNRYQLMGHYEAKKTPKGRGKYQCAVCKLSFGYTAEWLRHQSQTSHSSTLTVVNETADNAKNVGTPKTVQNVDHSNSTSIDSQSTDASVPTVHQISPTDDPESKLECQQECESKSNRIDECSEDLAEDIRNMEHENIFEAVENPTIDTIDLTAQTADSLVLNHTNGAPGKATTVSVFDEVTTLHLKSLKEMGKTYEAIANESNRSSEEGRRQWRNDQVMEQETEQKFNKPTTTLQVECSGDTVEVEDMDQDVDLNNSASKDLQSIESADVSVPEMPVDEVQDTCDDSECKLECEPECEFKSNRIEDNNENPDEDVQDMEHENIQKSTENPTIRTVDQIVESESSDSNLIPETNLNAKSGDEDQNEDNQGMEYENIDGPTERPTSSTIDLATNENLDCDLDMDHNANQEINGNLNQNANMTVMDVPMMTMTNKNTENRSECVLQCQSNSEHIEDNNEDPDDGIQDMDHESVCKRTENPTICAIDETLESDSNLIQDTNQNAKPGDQDPIEDNHDMEHENSSQPDNPMIDTIDLTTNEFVECDLDLTEEVTVSENANYDTNPQVNGNANRNAADEHRIQALEHGDAIPILHLTNTSAAKTKVDRPSVEYYTEIPVRFEKVAISN